MAIPAELQFASRTWHYDTRYYDTQFQSTKRIVVRVWAGDAKTKGNPLAEATGFYGSGLSTAGNSNSIGLDPGQHPGDGELPPAGSAPTGGERSGTGTPTANGTANCTNTNANGMTGTARQSADDALRRPPSPTQ